MQGYMTETGVRAMTQDEVMAFLGQAPSPAQGQTPVQGNGESRIDGRGNIARFVLAGNAYFTLVSGRTGERYTYHVSKAKPNPAYRNQVPTYFVSLLTGPDNRGDYSYLGLLQDLGIGWGVRQTRGSKVSPTHAGFRGIQWYLGLVLNGREPGPGQVEFLHAGRCGRCGRMLTVPESIEIGLGPECATKE